MPEVFSQLVAVLGWDQGPWRSEIFPLLHRALGKVSLEDKEILSPGDNSLHVLWICWEEGVLKDGSQAWHQPHILLTTTPPPYPVPPTRATPGQLG